MDNINNMPEKIFNFSSAIVQYVKELSRIGINAEMKKIFQKGIDKRAKKTSWRNRYLYIETFGKNSD